MTETLDSGRAHQPGVPKALFVHVDPFAEARAKMAKLAQMAVPQPGSAIAHVLAAQTAMTLLPVHQKFVADLQRAISLTVAASLPPKFDDTMFSVLAAQRSVFEEAVRHSTRHLPGLAQLNAEVSKSVDAALSVALSHVSSPPSARRLENPWAGITPLTFIMTFGGVAEALHVAAPDLPDKALVFWALVTTMFLLGMYNPA